MADSPNDKAPSTVNFDYIKGSDFRVFHVDGAYLAGGPSGINVSLYSERQPIPRRVVHKVGSDYSVGEEIVEQRVVRDAIIRDVEVALAMNLEVAKNLYKALGDIIGRFEDMTAKRQGEKPKG
jgi:hypothetical protein